MKTSKKLPTDSSGSHGGQMFDEVLKRMLSTPPPPPKTEPAKKTKKKTGQ